MKIQEYKLELFGKQLEEIPLDSKFLSVRYDVIEQCIYVSTLIDNRNPLTNVRFHMYTMDQSILSSDIHFIGSVDINSVGWHIFWEKAEAKQ